MITPITVTAGQSTSAPQIANGFINPVNSQAAQIFAAFANEPGAEIPYGTTASWADASQLAVDTQRAGNYAEDVLISFPDGSTTTIQAALTVQPAAVTLTDSNEAANSRGGGNASQRISRGNQHSSNRSLDYFNDGCQPERNYQSPYN